MIHINNTLVINTEQQALIDYNKALVNDYYNLGLSIMSFDPTVFVQPYKNSTEFIVVNYDGNMFEPAETMSDIDIINFLENQAGQTLPTDSNIDVATVAINNDTFVNYTKFDIQNYTLSI